ncbi:MAG: WD40 repeat domain-containing protein [Actinomycetota bacterium]
MFVVLFLMAASYGCKEENKGEHHVFPAGYLRSFPASGAVFSPLGDLLLSITKPGFEGHMVLLNAETGREIRQYTTVGAFDKATFSPDGLLIAAGGVIILDANSGSVLGVPPSYTFIMFLKDILSPWKSLRGLPWYCPSTIGNGLAFSPDGTILLATAGAEVTFCDVASGKQLRIFLHPNHHSLSEATFSSDGRLVLAGTHYDGDRTTEYSAFIWSNPTGEIMASLPHRGGPAF